MDDRRLVKTSKYLSKHLRHQPERLGLELGPGGWVDVEVLLGALDTHGFALTRAELEEVVERNDKRRFTFDAERTRIRAAQGHSVAVDLELEAVPPPAELFHGTPRANVDAILREGLRPGTRQHVHLSPDLATARRVGRRRDPRPAILVVRAAELAAAGHAFYRADNGVWLTDAVPPTALAVHRHAGPAG